MELMRHSDMKMTTKIYTDAGMLQEAKNDAVYNLPTYLNRLKNTTYKSTCQQQDEFPSLCLR